MKEVRWVNPDGSIAVIFVHPNFDFASIGARVWVGYFVQIENNARIGKGVSIGAYVRIGHGVQIGNYSTIGDNVRIGKDARIGSGVTIPPDSIVDDYDSVGC